LIFVGTILEKLFGNGHWQVEAVIKKGTDDQYWAAFWNKTANVPAIVLFLPKKSIDSATPQIGVFLSPLPPEEGTGFLLL